MKIKILDDGIMLVPETNFETDILNNMYGPTSNAYVAFLKHGVSADEIIGLKISTKIAKKGV